MINAKELFFFFANTKNIQSYIYNIIVIILIINLIYIIKILKINLLTTILTTRYIVHWTHYDPFIRIYFTSIKLTIYFIEKSTKMYIHTLYIVIYTFITFVVYYFNMILIISK